MQTVIEPIPGPQREFIECQARYPAYIGGVGSGKTIALMIKAMTDFSTWGQDRAGMMAIYTVPVMGNVEMWFLPKWNDLYREYRGTHWEFKAKEKIVTFPNDGAMILRSAGEPDALRGGELARVYMDEAASLSVPDQEPLFRVAQGRIRQKGFGPQQVCVVTTPQQTRRWIIQRWKEGINPLTKQRHKHPENYPAFWAHTDDNPYLDPVYKADLEAEWGDTRYGRQERGGETLSVEGVLFDDIDETKAYVEVPPGTQLGDRIYGVDFGWSEPMSIIEWSRDERNRLWATDELYGSHVEDEEWLRWLGERNAKLVMGDPSKSLDTFKYWRQKYKVNIHPSRTKAFNDRFKLWRHGARGEIGGLGTNIFVTRSCPNLREELPNLAQKMNRYGEYDNEMAPGVMDHAYDAASYGLSGYMWRKGRPPRVFEIVRAA